MPVPGPAFCARPALAAAICRAFDLPAGAIEAVPTAALGQKAPRPLRAGLRCERLAAAGIAPPRPIADGLREMRAELGPAAPPGASPNGRHAAR